MTTWAQPQEVDDVTAVFPANVIGTLLPEKVDIPREFFRGDNPWSRLTARWFYKGLKGRFIPKAGIDPKKATRHLATVMQSFEPQHEHKEAGVAYLMSLWFDHFEAADPS